MIGKYIISFSFEGLCVAGEWDNISSLGIIGITV